MIVVGLYVFFFKQKTAYEMRISDWSSDVCSSDLGVLSHGLIAGVIDAAMAMLTLAMMIYYSPLLASLAVVALAIFVVARLATVRRLQRQIGRESCRARVCQYV